MRILVCGDRNWIDRTHMMNILDDTFNSGDTLIYGCCRGADNIAYDILRQYKTPTGDMDINIKPFPADWDKYGKAAGPIRNQQMIDEGKPDIVLAFHNNIAKSKGTMDMIKRANAAGIEVRIYAEGK